MERQPLHGTQQRQDTPLGRRHAASARLASARDGASDRSGATTSRSVFDPSCTSPIAWTNRSGCPSSEPHRDRARGNSSGVIDRPNLRSISASADSVEQAPERDRPTLLPDLSPRRSEHERAAGCRIEQPLDLLTPPVDVVQQDQGVLLADVQAELHFGRLARDVAFEEGLENLLERVVNRLPRGAAHRRRRR